MSKVLFRKLLPWLVIVAGIVYGLWPADIIPDIPVVGWIDDMGVMGTVIFIALKLFSSRRKDSGSRV